MAQHLPHRRGLPGARRARGVALIVGLIILVLLALIGTSAYSVATQEERMAGNARDHARAFEAAEAALHECERQVPNLNKTDFDPTGSTVPGMFTAPTAPIVINGRTLMWNGDADPKAFLGFTSPAIVIGGLPQPRCIAEAFDPKLARPVGRPNSAATLHVARVTAMGYGINSGTNVRLVSYVSFYQ